MAVSQRFIDLLNVPLEQLRKAGEEVEIVGAASMTKWPLAGRLAELSRADLEELVGAYLYAGRTSLSFFRLDEPQETNGRRGTATAEDDPDPVLEGESLDVRSVNQVLRDLSEGDPFSESARPQEVTREPKLVVARPRDDGAILLSFAVERPVAQVIRNFTPESVYADDFFNAVLYPDDGLIEVRTNLQTAAKFARTWLADFAKAFDLATYPVTITDGDFAALKEDLGAGMTRSRVKTTSGGAVDTIEWKAKEGFDELEGDDEFEEYRAGKDQVQGDLKFAHDGNPFTIRVSRLNGSIYFITPAPEITIDYVRESLRRIKVRHRREDR